MNVYVEGVSTNPIRKESLLFVSVLLHLYNYSLLIAFYFYFYSPKMDC